MAHLERYDGGCEIRWTLRPSGEWVFGLHLSVTPIGGLWLACEDGLALRPFSTVDEAKRFLEARKMDR